MIRSSVILLLGLWLHIAAKPKRSPIFTFTESAYNITIEENSRGKVFGEPDRKMGVYIPHNRGTVKFKIVQGDENNFFKAVSKEVGNFAYLRIRTQPNALNLALNRELKDVYPLLVKATFRQKGSRNLETRAEVFLRILDQNDLVPLFMPASYNVELPDDTAIMSEIVKVFASDADQGLNGEVYYSLKEPSATFSVHPLSGSVMLLKNLDASRNSNYELTIKAEDRASRLQHSRSRQDVASTAAVKIRVTESNRFDPEITVKKVMQTVIRDYSQVQTIALIEVLDKDKGIHGEVGKIKLVADDFTVNSFHILPAAVQGTYKIQTVVGATVPPAGIQYNLTVFAEDKGFPPRNASVQVSFLLTSGNESELRFHNESLHFYVNETMPVGAIVGVARLNQDGHLATFALVDSEQLPPFGIHSGTGVIFVAENLDFETRPSYSFHVRATRPPEAPASVRVFVEVLDENDNSPIFTNESTNLAIELDRNTPLESVVGTVKASDVDSGANGKVSYQWSSGGNVPTPFLVDPWSGDITLRNKIVPSAEGWILWIRAVDWGQPLRREVEIPVVIRIRGADFYPEIEPRPESPNRHRPKFENTDYSADVPEDTPVGAVFTSVFAKDRDFGYNGMIQYVLEGNDEGLFDIDPYTGGVKVLSPLENAKFRTYKLTVRAFDCGSARKSAFVNLRIRILDVNDHCPVFERSVYRISVKEDEKTGKELLRVRAEDADEGVNAEISYEFLLNVDEFRIDSKTGIIRIVQPLDRERIPFYSLRVKASDGGFPPKSSLASVEIEILDINDNPPKCNVKSYKVQVVEDWPTEALVTCLSAADADSGVNGEFSFALDPAFKNLPFGIDPKTGCVRVTKRLNFEKRPLYNISVEVTDHGVPQYSSVCHLLIELMDVNENFYAPVFVDENSDKLFSISTSVPENEPVGREVGRVTARDPDDSSSVPTYSLVSGDGLGLFMVDSDGVIRTSAVLDRETRSSYWLTVLAEDSGTVPRSSQIDVFVDVLDSNDHAPRPGKPIYFTSVLENSLPGTLVTRVEAFDPDEPDADGRGLLYQISRGDPQSFFAINSKTGYITTHKRMLDRETQERHELEVTIRDSGDRPLSTVVRVVIDVADVNDHSPEFQRKIYNFNILPVADGDRTTLCRVIASDGDTGINAELRYNISDDSDSGNRFGIYPKTGEIFAESAVDPDDSFALTVNVFDLGTPSLSSQARVMLAVLPFPNQTIGNDPPVLNAPDKLEFHVSDAEKVGETIGILEAAGGGHALWFNITEGNTDGMFYLRKDAGELQLARSPKSTNISKYELRYSVTDGLNRVNGQVVVHVTHSDERRPQFDQLSYTTSAKESAPVGTVVEQMNAFLETNGDSYQDQSILYFMHETESPITAHKFKVEARTGRVVVVRSLDHEVNREHRIVIGARFKNLVNLATLIVKVEDENDFEPRFLKSYYESSVYETVLVGHPVLHVLAVDRDSGSYGKLSYSIVSGNEQGLWELNPSSGRISVAKPLSLDYPETVLVVKVSDGGDPPLSATATVQILVVMAADSVPRFTQDTYFLSVSEDEQPGTFLGEIYAESWSGIQYGLEEPKPEYFDVHPASGAVFLKRELDFETRSYYNFSVVASSSSGAVARAQVRMSVRDSNDQRPIFEKDLYEGGVQENMPAGTVVMKEGSLLPLVVAAVDSDKGPNAIISYQVADSWARDYFTVDYGTGAVRTKKQLDHETQSLYEFEVLALDLGSFLFSPVSTLVRVKLSDVNDNAPLLIPEKISRTLFTPAYSGVFVTQLRARDIDTVGELRFSIVDGARENFKIDESTGVIRVSTTDFLDSGEYDVPVEVSDGIHIASGLVSVLVKSLENNGEGALKFTKEQYHVSVMENVTDSGPTSILVLQTEGRELGEHVSYTLLNENTWFSINSVTGELTTVGVAIDRESTPMKVLVVQATDQRIPPRICQTLVKVHIQDINDCAPKFLNQPYYAVLPLDASAGTNVTSIKAVDADEGKNGAVSYRKVGTGSGSEFFLVNPTSGLITLAKEFPKGMKSDEYFLNVSAVDGGDPQFETRITVRIKVVNKAMPVFDRAFYGIEVSENATVGTSLLTVVAKSNVGGTVAYSIVDGDPESNFDVDYLDALTSDTLCVLVLEKSLDRELTSRYDLTLRAIDVSRPSVHADVPISVEVQDSNDEKPEFQNLSYSFHVSESLQIGARIGQVLASDRDAGVNAKISYQLSGSGAHKFEINKSTGEIYLKAPLDFEETPQFIFEAVAVDGGFPSLSGRATVKVTVTDVNDNPPKFSQLEYVAEISNDAVSGHFVTQVSASDPDTVFGTGRCIYSILDGEDSVSFFRLHSETGTLETARSLKLAKKSLYHLNVSATDGVFTAYAKLTVHVVPTLLKVDSLRFEKLKFEASVKENSPYGTTVLTVEANGGASPLSYAFAGRGGPRPFIINQETGSVTVSGDLDFELKNSHSLSVMVQDDMGTKAFAELFVSVVNVNDNAPEFIAQQYSASVRSNASRGEIVLKIVALDPDVDDVVEYSIIEGDPSGLNVRKFFRLHGKRGELSVKRSLASLEGKKVELMVGATDRGNPPLQTEVPVQIYITSSNDPQLKFSEREFTLMVSEDANIGHDFGMLPLTRENFSAKYTIMSGVHEGKEMPFAVDRSGVIVVTEKLDREDRDEFFFTVSAVIEGTVIGTSVPVRVAVTDVNDNAPKFDASYDKLEISEDAAVGSSLTVISATDEDIGQAGQKEFFIRGLEAERTFKIDPGTGWLILDAPLDRETKEWYNFTVMVKDGGQPPLSSSANVQVRVLDRNDRAPSFEMEVYEFSVGEGSKPGTVIGKVRAVDEDLDPYNKTELFIVDGNEEGHFGLRDTGELYVRNVLDFERKKEHRIRLLATDGRHTGSVTAKIYVTDENDNAPMCESEYKWLVLSEDVEVGSEVLTMVADDADSGQFSVLTFKVTGSDDFSMNGNGILLVAKNLDRERQSSYSLVVKAMDIDGLFCETRVAIKVADVNDTPPKFTKSLYETSVKENMGMGPQFLIRVKAEDPDLGPAGKVQYALLNDDLADIFWVDEITGALTVAKPLDREERSVYNLRVMAKDQDPEKQLSATAEVVVRVLDVNDNPPEFTQSRYFAVVSEDEDKGLELVTVEASSADASDYITYQLITPEDSFELDPDTGILRLRKQLDFEVQSNYFLIVEAVDSGIPPLTAQATVNVTVTDSNDNAPKFTQSLYESVVLENATVGTKILQVEANDLDSGANGKLVFRFSPDNVLTDEFKIEKDGGWISVASPLDRESRSQYRLLIEVWDNGDTPLTDNSVVKIVVGDVNDNPPVFSLCNLTATVQEGLQPGFPLMNLEVEDADGEGNGAPFRYGVMGDGAQKFSVDPDGTLVTGAKLLFKEQSIFLLTVEASDSGVPSLYSECPLTIEVLEESKHAPDLKPVSTEINSYLGEFPGGTVAKAVATDKDPRDVVTYGIAENPVKEMFTIGKTDGAISAGAGMSVGVHKLNVSATDGKFTTYAKFELQVNVITEDALEYAVSMKIRGVSIEEFVRKHRRKLSKIVARLLSVRPRNVNFLSIQPPIKSQGSRYRRENSEEIEILFNVKKGVDGFYKPNFIKRRLEGRLQELSEKIGVEVVSVTTEMCRSGLCVRGQCREKLTMNDVEVVSILTDRVSFVAPKHHRSFECICQEGYGGDLCNVAVNACSRDPCSKWEMCIPLESAIGFQCVCPAGKTGARCQESTCTGSECESSMSFTGKSYLRYTLSTALDKRLQLAVEIRTMAANGIVMMAAGQADYNILEVRGGLVQYRFDCGSGEGIVRITDVPVTDGNWHLMTVIRRGRHAKLSLDDKFTAEGYSAGKNTIINLESSDVFFGAEVRQHPTLYGYEEIRQGFTGCLNRIFVDGFQLPRSKPGMRLYNVNFECSDTFITGVCSSQPCENFGTCVAEQGSYSCICHPRFTGRNCEMDLNPCASQPCTHGATCENLYNDFFCRCTSGFTGKTCSEVGDFDECISSPCGSNGICINTKGSFICNCTGGWSGIQCTEKEGPPNMEGNQWGITIPEIIGILAVLLVLLLLTLLIVLLCRRRANVRYHKARYLQTAANNEMMLDHHPHIRNHLVTGRDFGTVSPGPPPIPPRARGFHPHRNSKLSNLESAQMTGLPTVQVRPLSFAERESPSDQRFDERWAEDPGACPARRMEPGMGRNLEAANNYGSAAEDLEQLSRFSNDLMQTFGKRLVPAETVEQNLRNPENNGSGKLPRRGRIPDDWKAALDLLSLDSIERLKAEAKLADAENQGAEENRRGIESEAGAQSMASIQCLPEEDQTQGPISDGREVKSYHWDYSDWNSTLGQPAYPISEVMTDDEDGPLPHGVSALDDTDSEYVGDSCLENEDEEPQSSSRFLVSDFPPNGDFKQQLMALQKLTNRAQNSPLNSPEKRIGGPAVTQPEDEYVTMKPVSSYQKYLPKHRSPPDSSRSQRKPLLMHAEDGDRSESDSEGEDSDGADSCQAVVHYGFPKNSGQIAAKLRLHTYDVPADADRSGRRPDIREPFMSSFRDLSKGEDTMQSSMEGQLSQPVSTSDISGVCEIEDSEYPGSEEEEVARIEMLLSPNSARKQTQV